MLPCLWRGKSGETIENRVVWAKQPAITTDAAGANVWIDLKKLSANVVLVEGGRGYQLTPKQLKEVYKVFRDAKAH